MEILYFMSVGEASFEERRVHDYLAAYQSTGRPPPPCPQSPDTPDARAALGLAPLFVPVAVPVPSDTFGGETPAAGVAALGTLPSIHVFSATTTPTGESFESLAAQTLYSHFSHEELRWQAYHAGHKLPPPVGPSASAPFYARDSQATAYTSSSAVPGTPDYFMSISAAPKFDKHSFEELRIAYLSADKEVGSSEIPSRGVLPAQAAPTLFGRPRGDAFSTGSLKLF